MPAIEPIPVMKPMTMEELVGRIQRGWRIEGQVIIPTGSGVITPDNPTGQTGVPVNVWVLPEPMVPLGELISTILALDSTAQMGQITAAEILGHFTQAVIGTTVEQLRLSVEKHNESSGDDPPPDGAQHPGWVQ